jgi:hypothetical protein
MEAKKYIFDNQFHSQTSSKTYPYPKGEHMGAVGAQICEYLLITLRKVFLNCRQSFLVFE